MLIYEVTATVEAAYAAEYERYMREDHIPDVLASKRFVSASLLRAAEGRYRVVYEVADEATLQDYLDNHAPALRAHFAARFPVGIELAREVWTVLERWGSR